MTPHLLSVAVKADGAQVDAAGLLSGKSMPKQFGSSNSTVFRQIPLLSSCDGLCTDQNEAAAMLTLVVT